MNLITKTRQGWTHNTYCSNDEYPFPTIVKSTFSDDFNLTTRNPWFSIFLVSSNPLSSSGISTGRQVIYLIFQSSQVTKYYLFIYTYIFNIKKYTKSRFYNGGKWIFVVRAVSIMGSTLSTRNILNQGFLVVKLKSSLRTLYGRQHDLVDRHGISVLVMTTDMFRLS
jgi:hypothetical protein